MNQLVQFIQTKLPVLSVGLQRAVRDMELLETMESVGRPQPPTTEVRNEAMRKLSEAEAVLVKASTETVRRWLLTLGALTAGKMSVRDAEVKITAYQNFIDHPEKCFTEATLKSAARRFKWFPSFSEVSLFLDRECRDERVLARRLRNIADGPTYDLPVQAPLKERQAQIKRLAKEFPEAFRKPKKRKPLVLREPLTKQQKRIRKEIWAKEMARREREETAARQEAGG